MNTDVIIAALETELAGYIRRGLTARADLVATELRRLGRSPGATPAENVPVEPASTPTRARRAQERVRDAAPVNPPETPKKPARSPKK